MQGMNKKSLQKGNGESHQDFKCSVLLKEFYNIYRKTFGKFKVVTSDPFGSQETSGVSSTGDSYRYERLEWLKPNFVKIEAVQAARARVEQVEPKDAK